MFLKIIELILAFMIVWTGITQIIIPFLRGTVYFPIFRKERKLENGMAEAKQNDVENKLQKELNRLNRNCSSCKHPEARICKEKKSPNYNQKVLATDSCGSWEERI